MLPAVARPMVQAPGAEWKIWGLLHSLAGSRHCSSLDCLRCTLLPGRSCFLGSQNFPSRTSETLRHQ